AWVLTLRLAVFGGVMLYSAYPGGVQLGAGAVALVAVGLVATGPEGLGYWTPPEPTDEEVYAADLWFLLRIALRLPEDEPMEKWLAVPDWFAPGAQVRLDLPQTFVGTDRDRAGLDDIVKVRLPGRWSSRWSLMGGDHHVLWSLRQAREPVGDEATYGPALWPILREQIALPEPDQAWMEDWLTIPADLADEDATVRLVLPLTFVGAELDRQNLTTLINLKLPGEWVARWQLKSGQQDGDHWVQWTHKPPAPPKPACPAFLDFFDPRVQEAIFACAPGEVVLGMDAFGEIVTKRLEGDSAHWALSIGSGGGKSNLIQFIILQLAWQGWTIVATDPKRNSVACFSGLPGFYLYNDPMAVGDMRRVVSWFRKVAEARQYVQLRNASISLPGVVLIMEEANETADLSKEWWRRNKPNGAPAGDPFWAEVASCLRTARSVNGHVIGVFQDLRDDKTGNQGMSVLFPEIIMGKIKEKQWDRIIGGRMPDITANDQAGRILVNRDGERIWLQVPSCNPPEASPARYMEWAQEARSRRPWTYDAAGLYGTPPKPQEQEVPALLKGTSHDPEVNPTPAVLLDKIPAQSRDTARTDMPHDAALDALRDAMADGRDPELRAALLNLLAPRTDQAGQAPADAQQAAQAPTEAPEERLPIAEIARRFKALEIPITEANIRQHKTRNKDKFPTGTGPKSNLFLASEIRAYFQEVEERKQKRVGE
ncbi:hypothetical protein ACIBCA_37135, partial [Kitasatospora sp. NPDC051170]|uniref:hypothetical protein n=1 Tax=Kitasatospora sp. NPDC051170 TaxID=3364056 RepID=UPI0037A4C5FD